jgi:hypothetical protein
MHLNALEQEWDRIMSAGIAIELISPPGAGKSDFVKYQTEKRGWGLSTQMLSCKSPMDMLGFNIPREREIAGRKTLMSAFTLPDFFMCDDGSALWEHENSVLFFDEWAQNEPDMKRLAADLLLNGRIGPHRLPKGCRVVMASNRTSDRSGATKTFDFIINRILQIHISHDVQSWVDWATKHSIDPLWITFALQQPTIVFSDAVPKEQGPYCTPRSFVRLERLLRGPNGPVTHPEAVELAAGVVGQAAAAQIFAHFRLKNEAPSIEEIVANPKGVHVPEKPDARMLVCYMVANRVTKKDAGPCITYMERLPKEFATIFARAATKRDPSLVNEPSFAAWCGKNASLVNALNR